MVSMRHPQISLKDTIVAKICVLVDPYGERDLARLREHVGEIVDDLAEYAMDWHNDRLAPRHD